MSEVKSMLSSGQKESEIRVFFREKMGLKRSQGNALYNKVKKEIMFGRKENEKIVESTPSLHKKLVCEEKFEGKPSTIDKNYYYNEITHDYVFFIKSAGRNVVVNEGQLQNILRAYSSSFGDARSVENIAEMLGWNREYVIDLLKCLNFTHDSIPVLPEKLNSCSDEDVLADLDTQRKFVIKQKYEKLGWNQIIQDAEKWRLLKFSKIDPFESYFGSHQFPEYKPRPFKTLKPSNKHLIINIADIHVGLKAEARYLYFQKNWNTQCLIDSMHEYAEKIKNLINERTYSFDSVTICLGGDIIHSLTAFTDKGTKLECEVVSETQLDYAFTILISFFNEIVELFPIVNVKSVQGNHDSIADYTVSRFLQAYFRKEDRVKFDITTERFLPFKINSENLFVLEHGYSAKFKSKLPRSGAGRDAYIQNVLLAKPELLQGVKNKYYITNDQHHLEIQERSQYQMILCPTIVGGDRFSDNSLLNSRPSQSVFVVDNKGIVEILNLYFD